MNPLLLVDCYMDGASAAPNFLRYLEGPFDGRSVSRDSLPTTLSNHRAMVISGSAASVLEPPEWMAPLAHLIEESADQRIPLLGVCFGHQLVAHTLCGPQHVRQAPLPEVGWLPIEVLQSDPLFDNLTPGFTTFVSHGDEVVAGHSGMRVLAQSQQCAVHGFRMGAHPIWGVQFHSEMDDEETTQIVYGRAERHPELAMDPDATLAKRTDSTRIARTLFGNFMTVVQSSAQAR